MAGADGWIQRAGALKSGPGALYPASVFAPTLKRVSQKHGAKVCQKCAGALKPFNRTRVRVSFDEWTSVPLNSEPSTGTLLPVRFERRVYFVSYGGEAFPTLIMVLRGYGVMVDLVGDTDINRLTSTTFKAVLDAPFSSFKLTLPEGPYSALAANGNLCQQNLVMSTDFVAQNGATLDQSTHIEVRGYTKLKLHKQIFWAAVGVCQGRQGSGRVGRGRVPRKN